MIAFFFDRACGRHRAVLLESVEGRWDAASPAALAHLDQCPRCERELSLTALTLAGLRRLAAESRYVEPSPDGWTMIRGRLQRPAPARWPAAFGLGKAVVSVGVLVTLIAPVWISPPSHPVTETMSPTETVSPAVSSRANGRRAATPSPRAVSITTYAPRYEKGPKRLNPTAAATRTAVQREPPAPRVNQWWTR